MGTENGGDFSNSGRKAFPEAKITKYEPISAVLTNQAKDRHVLAAAIRGHATTIVTFNLKDFPLEALEPWGVEAQSPSEYLLTLYSISPAVVVKKLGDIAVKRKADVESVLITLGESCPRFATHLLKELG